MKAIKKIKEYLLLNEIGRGSFGKVFEALSEKTNKLFAIKALSTENFKNPRILDQFKKELKILFALNHQNIIKIIGVEKTINNIYLILEYCNGGTLLDYVTWYKKTYNKNIPEEIIQKILKQIIEGLKYMHKNNIIHRDIKLENILINFDDLETEYIFNDYKNEEIINKENFHTNKNINNNKEVNSNYFQNLNDFINSRFHHNLLHKTYNIKSLFDSKFTIKIADLGYARILNQSECSTTICGTPLFMAPDIVNLLHKYENNIDIENNNYNSSIDIWSLGIVFYELLIGTPPFTAIYNNEIFNKILAGVYEIPKNIKLSVEALSFLTGLMEFYPEKRFKIEDLEKQPFIMKNISDFVIIQTELLEDELNDNEITNKLSIDKKNSNTFISIDSKETNNLLIKMIKYFKIDLPQNNIDNKKTLYKIINENILDTQIKKTNNTFNIIDLRENSEKTAKVYNDQSEVITIEV